MAMLACLWELSERLRLTLEVAAVDHGLRTAAAAEVALVAERAAALGLPFHAVRVDVKAATGQRAVGAGRGVPEVARRLRLAALDDLRSARGLDVVALGHQADDQAETVLFRILRGTGLHGLAGIPYHRAPFVRPLLDVTRAEIAEYLRRRSLPFATDPSNVDLRYARARIRHRVLPELRRENPRVDEALRRLACAAAARPAPAPRALMTRPSDPLAGLHVPKRVAQDIEDAAGRGAGTRTFDVPGGRVRVSYGRVQLERPHIGSMAEAPLPVELPGPGQYPFGTGRALAVRAAGMTEGEDSAGWAWFDAEAMSWPLQVRTFRPGDRMRPRGGRGSRKLSDLLIDAKIPRPERASLPIVTDGNGTLLFVPGLRPAALGAPGTETRERIGLAVVSISDHHPAVDPPIASGNTQRYRDPKGLS